MAFTVNGTREQHHFNQERPLFVDFKDLFKLFLDVEKASVEEEVRQFTLCNLNSYGAGMLLYSPQEISPNDGKLEVFTLEGPAGVVGMTLSKKVLKAGPFAKL